MKFSKPVGSCKHDRDLGALQDLPADQRAFKGVCKHNRDLGALGGAPAEAIHGVQQACGFTQTQQSPGPIVRATCSPASLCGCATRDGQQSCCWRL
eukprot:1157448-Pelagomonas_calceolata.AAC.5